MAENKSNYTQEEKEKLIKKEVSKLKAIFKNLGPGQAEIANRLIEEAAFLKVTLADLRETVNREGTETAYQNGATQWGTKKSPAFENYINANKQHSSIMKQLNEMLPETDSEGADGLMAFIMEGHKRRSEWTESKQETT